MKLIALALAAVLLTPSGQANAEAFFRTVKSGRSVPMHLYKAWKRDCSPDDGVVKVVTKPQHGKLTPGRVDGRIRHNRFSANDPCIGKIIRGFQVEYRSVPGYRGMDRFVIEVTFGRRAPVTDTYTVTVE
jgi:hypothetical protein